jgi:hypothetical protein
MKDEATRELLRQILNKISAVEYTTRLHKVHGIYHATPRKIRAWARGEGRIGSAVRESIEFDAASFGIS